jgi:hypothetical protein
VGGYREADSVGGWPKVMSRSDGDRLSEMVRVEQTDRRGQEELTLFCNHGTRAHSHLSEPYGVCQISRPHRMAKRLSLRVQNFADRELMMNI